MSSIAEFFVQNKSLLDAIENFVDKYIGAQLLRKCGIEKIVDTITPNDEITYLDTPFSRLIGNVKNSIFLKNVQAQNNC